jgi:hypothetical protein
MRKGQLRVGSRLRVRGRHVLLLALVASLTACYVGDQKLLGDGTLRADISQNGFLRAWGYPQRTLSVLGDEQLRARWGSAPPAQLFNERRPLDLWVYDTPPAELVFDDGDLVTWKTDQSAEQLRAVSLPPGSRYVGNDRQSLHAGLLRVSINQSAFRAEWGQPDRMTRIATAEDLEKQWGPGAGDSVLKGTQRPLDVWSYGKRGVELLFDGRELAAWKTQKTVKELAAEQ